MDRTDQLRALAKRQGVASIAKVILEDPDKYAKAITEKEFVDMLMEEARAYQKTGEGLDQAFSKMFQAQTADGLLLRQAHAAIKQANFPDVVTESVSKSSDGTAYDQLVEKAEKLRQLNPELSLDQAFSKVFTDPRNANLAEQERRENRPSVNASTSYPMPGRRH
jgi:hypothetical protein